MELVNDNDDSKIFRFRCSKCKVERTIELDNELEAINLSGSEHKNCGGKILYVKDKEYNKKENNKKEIETEETGEPSDEQKVEVSDISKVAFEIKELFVRNYYIKDDDVIDILLATAYSHILPDEPSWLILIAQSSGIKTELLRSFGDIPNQYIYPSSKITEHAIATGSKLDGDSTLAEKLDGRIWIIKDLTTLLESRPEKISAVTSQMREVYDGYISVDSGMSGGSKHVRTKTTLIAGVTPAIDSTRLFKSNMGERVLYKRIPPVDDEGKDALKGILKQDTFETNKKRTAVYNKVQKFLNLIFRYRDQNKDMGIDIKDNYSYDTIFNLADFIAELRVSITWSFNGSTIEDVGTPESPARLHKELFKLAYSLRMIRTYKGYSDNENVLQSIVKVAMDTVPFKRMLALTPFIRNYPENEMVYNTEVMDFLKKNKIPRSTARKPLEELEALNILEVSYENDNPNGSKLWKFNDGFFNKFKDIIKWFYKADKAFSGTYLNINDKPGLFDNKENDT